MLQFQPLQNNHSLQRNGFGQAPPHANQTKMINHPSEFKNRKRFRAPISGQKSERIDKNGLIRRIDTPSRLILPEPHFDVSREENVESFLAKAESILIDTSSSEAVIARTMREIYGVLLSCKSLSDESQWQGTVDRLRQHSILDVLHQDPFTRRAFHKPRGYAGDAGLMDHIYISDEGLPIPSATLTGEKIFRQTTRSSACQAVAGRRALIADFIDNLARKVDRPDILSLASGHLREADISSAIRRRQVNRLVAIDSDAQSLEEISKSYNRCNIECVEASARQVISGSVDAGTFDFIYSSGLYDYLSDGIATKLTARLFSKLNPGGFLLLTNFLPNIECVGYMETYMDWNLIYRNRCQMIQLTELIPEFEVAHVSAFAEEQLNIVFCLVERIK